MEYRIEGDSLPVVRFQLERGDELISEAGGRTWSLGPVKTEAASHGGVGGALGRMFSGESLFLSHYEAEGPCEIGFASGLPGCIKAIDLEAGQSVIAQKGAFLCGTGSISLATHFQKKIGSGLFAGEGFILQKVTGPGTAFFEIDGHAVVYELEAGEKIHMDTGVLAIMDETCSVDIVRVKGMKNIFFGGEGLFDTVVSGPGKVYIQSMPVAQLVKALVPFLPKSD
ncbi:MAG: AIM24 family protein [Tissierellia bacterium]|nr:AIM24 family protein [Tissierellia bacterium]